MKKKESDKRKKTIEVTNVDINSMVTEEMDIVLSLRSFNTLKSFPSDDVILYFYNETFPVFFTDNDRNFVLKMYPKKPEKRRSIDK
jgi:hypothetical protein